MVPTDATQVKKHLLENNAINPESAIKVTGLLGEITLECAKRYPEVKVTPDDRFYWDKAYVRKAWAWVLLSFIIAAGIIVFVVYLENASY
jgi:hypothetical protein